MERGVMREGLVSVGGRRSYGEVWWMNEMKTKE